jgi:hypothetical protein
LYAHLLGVKIGFIRQNKKPKGLLVEKNVLKLKANL